MTGLPQAAVDMAGGTHRRRTMNLTWIKSSASHPANACVEAARDGASVLVRHSKDTHGTVLTYSAAEWAAFLAGVKAGEFDHLAAGE